MVAVWPSLVPYENVADNAVSSQTYSEPDSKQTEGGPPIMRPRPGPRMTEMAWQSEPLEPEEWAAFERFARVELRNGVLPFRMPVYRFEQGFVTRTCQIKDGRFSTDPRQVPWRIVTFTLVVYNW